jgi:hypothetical protein
LAPDARSGTEPVRIHRGSAANEMAGALDARAFTHGGEIYLPDKHGPLGGQKAQSLVAHEMTHVVQQRRLGTSLPDETTPYGQRLEAEAAAAESHEMPLAIAPSAPQAAPTVASSVPTQPVLTTGFDMSSAVKESGTQRARASDAKFTDPDDAFRDKLRSNEDELFANFERRLRHQLLHERERGGTLIDAL